MDAKFLNALTLISGRKFVQAVEILRKVQENLTKPENEISPEVESQLYEKAAKIELIIADCLSQHS